MSTNDVHCGIDDYIGYSGLSAYKKELEAEGKNVLLVDFGEHIQGAPAGTLTKGDAIIKMMNEVGYDAATFGNHEFDFSVEQLLSLKEQANYSYVCCNFMDGDGNCVTDPYTIIEAGGRKTAFIGAVTPVTIVSSTPAYFQNESGEFIYSFCGDESGTLLYDTIQKSVDSAREEGADICILLAHLGVISEDGPYTSMNVIANTTGIDAVLDGHSHSVIESESVKNKDGKRVILQ